MGSRSLFSILFALAIVLTTTMAGVASNDDDDDGGGDDVGTARSL
jgi:hypothetical protein